MTISPRYGYFVLLTNPKLFQFVHKNFSRVQDLPMPYNKQLEAVVEKNADKLLMVPLHNENDPFYLPQEEGSDFKRRVLIWANPQDPTNPEKMVMIQEAETIVNGETVIIPERMMVGPKAPVYAQMKMSCCDQAHCGEAPFSAIPCLTQNGAVFSDLIDPEVGVLENRPEIFTDGIYALDASSLKNVRDLATHVWAHANKIDLPSHDCHHAHEVSTVQLGTKAQGLDKLEI